MIEKRTYSAFAGNYLLATDTLECMLLKTKTFLDTADAAPVLIFDDLTGAQIDFDFRGTPDDVLARLSSHPLFAVAPNNGKPHAGPGRPKLGVVCREISMLPRHWEWLEHRKRPVNGIFPNP